MDEAYLRSLAESGLSMAKISKIVGKSTTTVKYWLKKFGIKTKHTRATNTHCLQCGEISDSKRFCSESCRMKFRYNSLDKQEKIDYNTGSYNRAKQKGIQRKKEIIAQRGGGCEICGYNKNLAALVFHHINFETEYPAIRLDLRALGNYRMNVILEELAKCQLLCSNCHAELHHPDLAS